MRYESIKDLPTVCHYHLPEDALRLYQQAYNEAWDDAAAQDRDRDRVALQCAWRAVRERFMKDKGRWVPRDQS